ncbi:DUF4332 domain-containing protein [Desulfovibrio sp. JC010]|nr:DUF4332 domain-containing protein [Desulfovibrio sp. JC010]
MAAEGIKHSKHMFDVCRNGLDISEFSASAGLDQDVVKDITCMSDLVRINGVGPIYARIFLKMGIYTTQAIADSNCTSLYNELCVWTEKMNLKVTFNENDLQTCIDMAKGLPGNV